MQRGIQQIPGSEQNAICVQEVFAKVERLIGRAVDVTACLHHIAEPPTDAAAEKLAEVTKRMRPCA